MKIVCFADFHIGVRTHGKTDPVTGLNIREIQTLGVLDELVDYAIDNKINYIVFAGDMYKNNLPTPTIQDEINKRIKRAVDYGINFFILDGNHDVSKVGNNVSALRPFKTLGIDNVIHTRFHEEKIVYDKDSNCHYKFVFLPTHHTKEEINNIVNSTTCEHPTIFVGHLTMKDALLNDWNIADKEVYIDCEIFDKPSVSAVILGHLHKYQVLRKKPLIFYTGSTQRIDFNEEHQPKGFVVLDVEKDGSTSHKFVEIESQKFFTLKENFNEDEDENITDKVISLIKYHKDKIKNAIVRIQLELNESTRINEREVYEALNSLSPSNVLTIQKVYNQQKTVRNQELTEHISTERGLELYYKGKPREKERIKLGKEIIKKLEM